MFQRDVDGLAPPLSPSPLISESQNGRMKKPEKPPMI